MARFTLTLSLDDDAARVSQQVTVVEALEQAKQGVRMSLTVGWLRDVNGNRIGDWHISR